MTERFFVNREEFLIEKHSDNKPIALFISSTAKEEGSSYACFDDPEQYLGSMGHRLCFTERGLGYMDAISRDVDQFVDELKIIIKKNVSQMITSLPLPT